MREELEPDLIRGAQERAARALPVVHSQRIDGWWLRHSPEPAWWESATLPLADLGTDETRDRVEDTEKFYSAHGTGSRIQVNPHACPQGLDELLAERGYQFDGPVSLQIADTARVLDRVPPSQLRVDVSEELTRPWLDIWSAGYDDTVDATGEWAMLRRVEQPSAYLRVMVDDAPVAAGRVVGDSGWAGLFNLVTLPAARGKGAARAALEASARWARDRHLDHMYLQVTVFNTAARRLYARAGFREIERYHYRTLGL